MDSKQTPLPNNETTRQLTGMSRKRPMPNSLGDTFSQLSSKADLYNHLDKHLHVSINKQVPNFVVLYMSLYHVHKRLRQRYLLREKAADQKETHPLH